MKFKPGDVVVNNKNVPYIKRPRAASFPYGELYFETAEIANMPPGSKGVILYHSGGYYTIDFDGKDIDLKECDIDFSSKLQKVLE